jgi:hypothetical protein
MEASLPKKACVRIHILGLCKQTSSQLHVVRGTEESRAQVEDEPTNPEIR